MFRQGTRGPMLTRKQYELLLFINERLTEGGVSPSFEEMKDALGSSRNPASIASSAALEERGFIRRLPHRARALEVVSCRRSVAHAAAGGRARGFSPTVIHGDLRPRAARLRATTAGGRCSAAHGPHRRRHADRGAADPQSHHRRAAGHARQRRALRARGRGDSMIDAGILDGDTVLIQRSRHGRERRHRRGAHRRQRGDAEAPAPARRFDRAGARQHGLRDAHLRPRPRPRPGQAGRSVPPLLTRRRRSALAIADVSPVLRPAGH